MRVRAVAYSILFFAGVDLVVLLIAPVFGWVPVPEGASTFTIVALALAFFLALLAMIGALSVLATDVPMDSELLAWDPGCGECGHRPDLTLAFCDRCGASA